MRILTFSSLFPNAIDPNYGVFVYQRTASLANRPGNEVEVVSPIPYVPRWLKSKRWQIAASLPNHEYVGELTVHHPRYFLLPKVSMPLHGLSMFLGSFPLCRRLQREAKFDCIDAHFVYPDGFAAVLIGKLLGLPVTVSARGTDLNLYPSFALIRPMIRWTLRRSAAAIAVSSALKEKMVEVAGVISNPCVIPNGIDTGRFRKLPKEDARAQLGLPRDGQLIVSVGALVPLKGHKLLIEAAAKVMSRLPELRLYILGEGETRRELESLIETLGLQERIRLPGKRPNKELGLWYSAADISCLVSEREGWPNVLSESLACGTPAIGTRVGGIPEIIHSPELGILVDRTVEAIGQGIEQALSRPWNRERISETGRARTWSRVAEEVEELLKSKLHKNVND